MINIEKINKFIGRRAGIILASGGLCAVLLGASGQATSNGLVIKSVAEVQVRMDSGDSGSLKLARAGRVVPGDELIYTLEIRNPGPQTVASPTVVYAIPAHVEYIADSATGPGTDIAFSVDGGRTFDRPENLRTVDLEGHPKIADPISYTHIQWKFKNSIKIKSVAYARFRAVVK